MTQDTFPKRYKIERVVGSGGMGVVYKAIDQDMDRRVAIKVLNSQGDLSEDPSFFARFTAEAKLSAALKHPSVTTTYDVGITPEGSPFYVMEWLDGEGLDSLLSKHGPLPVNTVLSISSRIAGALGAAHTNGYLHRDIKPANVFLLNGDLNRQGAVKLLDFGVAQRVNRETGLTRTGDFVGSVLYMSPEQIRAQGLSPASDIWQLGVTMYEMLTGRSPFESSDTVGTLTAIMNAEVGFPDGMHLPDGVMALLKRFLAKNPELRPTNGSAALAEIENLEIALKSEVLPSPPASLGSRETLSERTATPVTSLSSDADRPLTPNATKSSLRGPGGLLTVGCAATAFALVGSFAVNKISPVLVPWFGFLRGVCLTIGGLLVGRAIQLLLSSRRSHISSQAKDVLDGARNRDQLSKTLAIQVDEIAARCKLVNEKFLAMTMALMVDEYGVSTSFDERQKALMNAVTLLEKLNTTLSPWYIRNDKLIALVVTSVGVISGLATIAENLVKALK